MKKLSTISPDSKTLQHIEFQPFSDRYMTLDCAPLSICATTFANTVTDAVHNTLNRKYKPSAALKKAVGVLIADLLLNAVEHSGRYGYREVGVEHFQHLAVGYRPFIAAVDAMRTLGFITVIPGTPYDTLAHDTVRVATRFRAEASFFEIALGHGVTAHTWNVHFKRSPPRARIAHPILLRSSSTFKRSAKNEFKGYKLPGARIIVDKTLPIVKKMSEQVHDINAFTAQQALGLGSYKHSFFQRIFGQGDTVGGNFTKGGRLYSPGKNSYQQMPSEERDAITINGEATVEVDIGSSFLTIYRTLLGLSFDPDRDPYEGIGKLPRGVAKTWVVMTFGHDTLHTRWPRAIRAKYRENFERHSTPEYGTGDLSKDHPIGRTQRTMLAALPELADWPFSTIGWGDLQYIESKAIVEAVHTLNTRYKVTALPIHDSIRVTKSAAALAMEVLSDAFLKHVGVRPAIKTK